MLTGPWPSPTGLKEFALSFDRGRVRRVLIVPALFDEANKLRRFTVEAMRRLDAEGIDTFLPDLPGTNESLARMSLQDFRIWSSAMERAALHFGATHVLAMRGGSLVAPGNVPCAHYAPVAGPKVLRALLRARVIQGRETGDHITIDEAAAAGRQHGLTLAGYECSAKLINDLETAQTPRPDLVVSQAMLEGPGLWLRAEPSEDTLQSQRLSQIVAEWLR